MSNELKPWYSVAIPHADIREGRLDEAVFAANVWAVAQDSGAEVYRDPVEFFKKSYLTEGLRTIIRRVASGLAGRDDGGDRVISLQTSFGGGKTHTLVSLWHLAMHAQILKSQGAAIGLDADLLNLMPDTVKSVAVFTNRTCDATQGRTTPDGIRTRTIWGEIAYQLGGKELYEIVRQNDEARAVPKGIFSKVLQEAAPCLILLDEIADYCVGAAAVPVEQSTLADQTISFIQELTEAIQDVPNAVAVATLPASALEVAQSEKGQEAFSSLEKRFQRLGADIKPVADNEIYDVVRMRLFEKIGDDNSPDYIANVARQYAEMYSAHSNEVPSDAAKGAFRIELEKSFPFHPTVIDTLYTRWGSHPDFQRTRGVLRLLANIIGDLWQKRNASSETQHFIQPSHIRWSLDALQAQLTRLWGPMYQSVAAADVVGDKSNSAQFDDERGTDYRNERISQGLAATILLGSFGGKADKAGFTAKELKMACSKVGLNWNYLDGALLGLEDKCHYLHFIPSGAAGKRYWFNTKPNVNKLIVQYRGERARDTFDDEILEALREEKDKRSSLATWSAVVDPQADLPEKKTLTLLLLHPHYSWAETEESKGELRNYVLRLSKSCGTKDRNYRNTLVFLAANYRTLGRLRQAYRDRTALKAVLSDYGAQLDQQERDDIKSKLETAEVQCREYLAAAYSVALRVHNQDVEDLVLQDSKKSLADQLAFLWESLIDEEWIIRKVGPQTLKDAGLVPTDGGIALKDAIEAFLRYTDKHIVTSRQAVTDGICAACRDGVVGIAKGTSLKNIASRYCKESLMLDAHEEGVWIIPPFEKEEPKAEPAPGQPTPQPVSGAEGEPTATGGVETPPVISKPENARQLKRIRVAGQVPMEQWSQLYTSFISPALRMEPKAVHIGFELEIEPSQANPLNPDDQAVKNLKESASQLRLKFEVE